MRVNGSTAVTIGLGAAILYLGAHAVTGPQGLVSYVDVQAREQALEHQLADLNAQREELRARASRLQDATLDLDYLDERARITLAAGDSQEMTFALDQH
ncbi:MAG TPA: septum formation initiator family protein [Caulobacterales bacterium]|nr:septum formation initiator family protein [Caulobacterales bacterium]